MKTTTQPHPVIDTQIVTIGPNHGKPRSRVWLEGKRLVAAGFTVGARYRREILREALHLTLDPDGRYKVSGKSDKPIIDITGKEAISVFTVPNEETERATVRVEYSPGFIAIFPN